MKMAVTGARNTMNITQERRVVDMSDQIALLDPNIAPFITILKRIKGGGNTRRAISPKIEWLEDDYLGNVTQVATAISAAGTTTLVVDDGSIIRPYDILNIPSVGENMLVTAVSDNSLTVTRGFGGTSAAASIAVDAEVLVIGNAQAENALARERRSTQEVAKFNYTQIFRTPFELSSTEQASKLYGGKDRAYQRRKALAEHKRDIALSMYFGQKKQEVSADSNTVRRTMGGLVEFIRTGSNVQAFADGESPALNLTFKNFNTYVAQPAFLHGSTEKLLIAGPVLAAAIDSWGIDKMYVKVEEDTFGVHVKRLITSYGLLNVVYDPLLAGSIYGGYGLVLDMENVRYAYLEGRDTKLHTNIQAPDQDGIMDEYLTECSLEVRNPDTHFLITGAYVA